MNQKSRDFCRFMSGSLTLRPRKTYIYVFRALFGFYNFQAKSCFLQKLGRYLFGSTLSLLSSLCAYTLQLVFPSLLKSAYKYWYYLLQRNYYYHCYYYQQLNANLGPVPVIQIVGKGLKYKYKLRRRGSCTQTQAPDW